MRLVVQRVTRAAVRIDGTAVGKIGVGAVVLVAIAPGDDGALVERVADELASLRYFDDDAGRTNLGIGDVGGALLVVSQFTLLRRHAPRPASGVHRRGRCQRWPSPSSSASWRDCAERALRLRPGASGRRWRWSSSTTGRSPW